MRRHCFVSLAVLLILSLVAFGDVLKLRSGKSLSGKGITYQSGNFDVSGKAVVRDSVSKIIVAAVEETKAGTGEGYKITQEQIDRYFVLADSMKKENPDASGLVFTDYGKSTLTSDGRELYEYRFAGKVLAQEKKDWANLSFYINEGISRVHILYARSIAPDGSITNYNPSDISYQEMARGAEFFGKGKIMSLTIPGVEVGSIVEYHYVEETYAPDDPELFNARFYFQSFEPVKESRYDVEVPKGRDFFYITQFLDDYYDTTDIVTNIPNSKIPPPDIPNYQKPKITKTDSSIIYTWIKWNVPPLIREPKMYSYVNVAPGVFGALYSDYSYYNKRFGNLHREHMKLTPTLDSLAKAIVGDATTDTGKIAKLYHWVQRNIRYISVKGALASSFGGHYAQITYDNKYGDCSDKAIFFATLLKAVGIEAYPIILMTNDAAFIDRSKFPYWGGNHAINEVWWDGKPHILDATNNLFRFPTYPAVDSDIWYANYVKGKIVYNPPVPPADNAMRSRTIVKLDVDGTAHIADSMWFSGQTEAGYRGYFEYNPKTRHRQIAESMANSRRADAILDTFAVINTDSIAKPFIFQLSYSVQDYPIKAGDYQLLEIPALRYAFPEIALEERHYGIKLNPFYYQRKHDVIFELPKGLKAEFVPKDISVSNPYFDYSAKYERIGNKIHFADEYDVKKFRVPVCDYDMYKKDAEKILAYLKERVFLVQD